MSKHRTIRKQFRHPVGSGGFQDDFQGTTAIYVVEPRDHVEIFLGDYDIEGMPETWPEEFRSYRQRRKRRGKAVPELPAASLDDRILIAFGPEVSARQAVASLERAIKSIKSTGLLVGRDNHGDLAWEQLDSSETD